MSQLLEGDVIVRLGGVKYEEFSDVELGTQRGSSGPKQWWYLSREITWSLIVT